MSNDLIEVLKAQELEPTRVEVIMTHFDGLLKQAQVWEAEAKLIVVTDVSQTEEMQRARNARLALKEIRVNAEKVRKQLKENSVREGKAIDGVANIIKAVVEPLEEHLEAQEKFAIRKEQERLDAIVESRMQFLVSHEANPSFYNLRDMDEAGWIELSKTVVEQFDKRKEAEAQAEAERIAKAKEEAAEHERLRVENEQLRQQQEIKEKNDAMIRSRINQISMLGLKWNGQEYALDDLNVHQNELTTNTDDAWNILIQELSGEVQRRADKEAEERRVNQEKLEAAERIRIAEQDAKDLAEIQRLEAEMAPDKEKLLVLAETIKSLEMPTVTTDDAKSIVLKTEKSLFKISQDIKSLLHLNS